MIQRLQAKRNEEGFTLIELLIVIIVLGILAAIVVFAIGSTRKDSVAASCKTNYKSIELSAEAVNTKMGGYPATQADLETGDYGGLLKAGGYPTSGDYILAWSTSGAVNKAVTVPGSPPVVHNFMNGYALTVQKSNGTPVGTNPTSVDGCDAL